MPMRSSMERFRPNKSQAQSSGDLQRRRRDGADLTLSLPPELLQLIASQLANICDYISFRSVCTRWRRISTATATATGGGQQHRRWLPWLIFPLTVEGDFLPIFNTSDCRFYNLPLPEEVRGPSNWISGSAYGWLVIVVNPYNSPLTKASLYNPITRAHILLPPVHPPIQQSPVTILLCCNPTTASPGQLLISITTGCRNRIPMLIYRQGDVCWTEIKMPPEFKFFRTHVTYLEEEATIYAATSGGMLAVLDLASLTFRILISSSSREIESLMAHWHLVASAGDLLFVASDNPYEPDSRFEIFKLNRDKEECLKWARATTIGNCTLFLSYMDYLAIMSDQGSSDRQANLIYRFRDTSCLRSDQNGVAVAIEGRIQVLDLIAGNKLCFGVKSKRIKYKNCHLHEFPWMLPNMS